MLNTYCTNDQDIQTVRGQSHHLWGLEDSAICWSLPCSGPQRHVPHDDLHIPSDSAPAWKNRRKIDNNASLLYQKLTAVLIQLDIGLMVRNQKLKMSCSGSTVLGVLLLLLATCLYNICKCGMQGFRTTAVQTVRMRKAKTNIIGK
jgi:hypothetical protein